MSPPDQDILRRRGRLDRPTAARRHHHPHCPDRHIYRTEPHGAAMFPALAQPTGELPIPPALQIPEADRRAMMPRRKQTRDQDRQDRINAERRERTELIAEQERQRQAWLAANYEPPPF